MPEQFERPSAGEPAEVMPAAPAEPEEPEGVPLEPDQVAGVEPEATAGESEADRRRAREKIELQVRMVADFWALRYSDPSERDRFRKEYVSRVTGVLEWLGWEDVQLVSMDPRRLPYGVRVALGLAVLVGGGFVIGPDGLQLPGSRRPTERLEVKQGGGEVEHRHGGGGPADLRALVDDIPDEG